MRDSAIIDMQRESAARDGLILRQFNFLKTRQEAFERVLKVSKFTDRLRWAVFPLDFLAVVDAVQMKLLDDAHKQMAAAAAKPKIEIVRPNGIA